MKRKQKVVTGLVISGLAVASVPSYALASWELDQWGNELLNVESYHQAGYTGQGVKVAILDSGIAEHQELNVVQRVNFVEGESEFDLNGHGTAVAGIIASKDNNYGVVGIAPNVELYSVKVLDQNGTTPNLLNVAEAVNWAIENDMDIINISLSAIAEQHPDVQKAFEDAEQAGILVVAGVGNHGDIPEFSGKISYPAKYPSVIAVGAIDEAQNLWYKSATGEGIDLVAPGVNIKTTYTNNQYSNSTGTSHAAPHVTGVLALLKEAYPEKTANELRQMVIGNAKDLGTVGYDTHYGYGLVQLPALPQNEEVPEEPVVEVPVENEPTNPTYSIQYDSESNSIQWNAVEGASRYRVEMEQKDENGEYQSYSYARSVAETSLDVTRIEKGYDYKFTVIPRFGWIYDREQAFEGTISLTEQVVEEEIVEEVQRVENIVVTVNETSAQLSWDSFHEASGYRVQAFIKNDDGTFVKDGFARSTTGTAYTFTNLDEGKEYQFAVIPRIGFYDESKQGTSESITIATEEPEVTVPEENESATATVEYDGAAITIQWSEQENISYYRVQRYIKEDSGQFVKDSYARTVRGTVYTDTRLEENQEYRYEIIPRNGFVYDYDLAFTSESVVTAE